MTLSGAIIESRELGLFGVALNYETAHEIFSKTLSVQKIVVVSVPNSRWVTNCVEAHAFFEENKS